MFKQTSNNLCNNILFSSCTIARMHEQVRRLYEAAKELRAADTPSAVARLLGVSPQTMKNWESRGISIQGMLDAERDIGVRAAWLRHGEGEMLSEAERSVRSAERPLKVRAGPDVAGVTYVRSVELTLRAGFSGTTVDSFEEDGEPFPVLESWLRQTGFSTEDLMAAKVRGNSMSPNLNDGDWVVIHLKSKAPQDNQIFAVNFDGEGVVKRLIYDFKRWFLYSDNPDQSRYKPQEASMAPNFIIGKVVLAQKLTF
ncbi:S24 family peptidase [Herbaspirillum huttiense]|uniref:helix-turn-helix domain-containing protein n=1 Tax=Herbaspirillum huttiense TaxID=863372 RepID=UPI00380D656B